MQFKNPVQTHNPYRNTESDRSNIFADTFKDQRRGINHSIKELPSHTAFIEETQGWRYKCIEYFPLLYLLNLPHRGRGISAHEDICFAIYRYWRMI